MAAFIPYNALDQLVKLLQHHGDVHGPVRAEDGLVRFAPVSTIQSLDLSVVRTVLPPKKYLLRSRETLLICREDETYHEPDITATPLVLLGVHPCDLAGIAYLDLVFLAAPPDHLYAIRRHALTLVGISCVPDQACSCHTIKTSLPASSDIFLHCIEEGWLVTTHSERGRELMKTLSEIIEERTGSIPAGSIDNFGQKQHADRFPEPDESLSDWQEMAQRCLGCGACSICCPTCYCFNVLECGSLEKCTAERLRTWDSCLFRNHSRVSGELYFHKNRAQRFRYRYRHKYHGFGPLHNLPSCVGCGRCLVNCPTGIDLRKLVETRLRNAP